MRKLTTSVMAALFLVMLWGASAKAADVPDCCKQQQARCTDGKGFCRKVDCNRLLSTSYCSVVYYIFHHIVWFGQFATEPDPPIL